MVFWRIFLLLGCTALFVNAGVIGSVQGITVAGRLACGDLDDRLNTTVSDGKGAFEVYGQDKEVTAIEPYLIIKHNCDNGVINPKCTITDEHPVPKEYIGKTYNMHIVSLNIAGKNHKKKFMLINCLVLLNIAVASTFAMGSEKNITVTGQVACSDRSQKDVEIQLWERDTLDPDDLLNTTITDARGNFRIYGEEDEVRNIEPYLIILHSCDNGVVNPKCSIKDRYEIPRKYVGDTYNMGIVSLNIVKKRQKNCV
ncbi:unnamed protein product [Litomosoides sigmodontis]|uniref:Uncharacterized protein n=1 Tax=Litomosoides sigmodontis TaxID=42156 RepID=A0A3P6SG59_LITSI|nr:unnamed protein product [Litomosoides sigmodontis]